VTNDLAIIVPAYRARFLGEALTSIEQQTDSGFNLYIFDDGSTEALAPVAVPFVLRNPASRHFHRFEENLGEISLSRHWDRCVAQTHEPWLWLFSDDDVMDKDCVSAWRTARTENGDRFDVYCFDSVEIDAASRITALHPPLPEWESWKRYAYFFLCGHRVVPQQAVVFSRAAYRRIGGFVELPHAWASDQATLMALAGETGIGRIPGPGVSFRQSGQNASSSADRRLALKKLKAATKFAEWLLKRIREVPEQDFPLSDRDLERLVFSWFKKHLRALRTWYGPVESIETARFIEDAWDEPFLRGVARMAKLDLSLLIERLLHPHTRQ
jgi:glycosyltransferase involved in cell wall biosynthesis